MAESENPNNILILLTCFLSLFGALSIIITYMGLPSMKGNGRRLLMWLSVADALSALNYATPIMFGTAPSSDTSLCKVQALIGIYFPVASFLWTDCIAWYLYQVVNHTYELNHSTELEQQRHLFPIFHGICWGLPAMVCIIIGAFGAEGYYSGKTGGWCWIHKADRGQMILWELIGGKAIEWFSVFVFVPYLYITAYLRLRRLYETDPQREKFHAFTRRLILVPVVFFLIRLWGSVLAVQTFIDPEEGGLQWVSRMSAFFDPSQGFFNGLIFVFASGEVREALKRYISTMFHKSNSHANSTIEPTNGAVEPSTASFLLHRPSEFEDDGTPFFAPISSPLPVNYEDDGVEEEPTLSHDGRFQKLINETA